AWWWEPFADAIDGNTFRVVALDQRGHGDSEWVRPPAYSPDRYASDLERFIRAAGLARPIVAGHSMGGIAVLSFAARYGALARAAIAIDVAVTSTPRRDRFMSRLKALPVVTYPDLATATARFRLMPNEGDIDPAVLTRIAEHSFEGMGDGRYTLKFDRESFFGSDGLDVPSAISHLQIPTLLIRAEMSRIMTAEASANAVVSNERVRLAMIPGAHHHVPLECPEALARIISEFAATVGISE
ncbi:MAG TPA: alpha/beta hydrolase, partial [Candidatus Binataceae bacterium]|nr:alpha/beta hydrolase [Candidatus Binataceae bacterium]